MRVVLTCSLLLLCALVHGQYEQVRQRLPATLPNDQVIAEVRDSSLASDPEISVVLEDRSLDNSTRARRLRDIVEMRAMLENPASTPTTQPDAAQIKSSPIYRDPGVKETSNWLSRALERLKNIKWRPPESDANLPNFSLAGNFLYYGMWTLLGAAAVVLLFLAVKHMSWKKRLQRKASALLEEDEPERTLDEWLVQADELEAAGKYREAVRALYLACLLRFDEAQVARFDRSQTNWEHLHRIEASPKLPLGLDFRPTTQLFDRVWYGKLTKGREDAQMFRQWYIEITEALKRKAA